MKNKSVSLARISQQIKSFQKEKLTNLVAGPLQNDMFTWHFTFQGPEDTDFHEGIYHGQIFLPFQYPFKPPDIVFSNNNGRFQTNKKICLTITQYHPEQWNSAWTIRTMLQAVISLFNQNIQGVGYVQASSQTRSFLAKQSHNYCCPKCGMIKDLLAPRQPRKQRQAQKMEQPNIKKLFSQNRKLQWTAEQIQKSKKFIQQERAKFNSIDFKQRKRRNKQLEQKFLKQQQEQRMKKRKISNIKLEEKRQGQTKPCNAKSSIRQNRLYQYNKNLFEQIYYANNQFLDALSSIKWLDE